MEYTGIIDLLVEKNIITKEERDNEAMKTHIDAIAGHISSISNGINNESVFDKYIEAAKERSLTDRLTDLANSINNYRYREFIKEEDDCEEERKKISNLDCNSFNDRNIPIGHTTHTLAEEEHYMHAFIEVNLYTIAIYMDGMLVKVIEFCDPYQDTILDKITRLASFIDENDFNYFTSVKHIIDSIGIGYSILNIEK